MDDTGIQTNAAIDVSGRDAEHNTIESNCATNCAIQFISSKQDCG